MRQNLRMVARTSPAPSGSSLSPLGVIISKPADGSGHILLAYIPLFLPQGSDGRLDSHWKARYHHGRGFTISPGGQLMYSAEPNNEQCTTM
ncbi:hypothetical protein HD806DRAFT_517257 [Xylariaceae sp. AK1471]|nr:hypothetical protein HD806DRAFT_517257 [Xylariaceae sp. AK1471]